MLVLEHDLRRPGIGAALCVPAGRVIVASVFALVEILLFAENVARSLPLDSLASVNTSGSTPQCTTWIFERAGSSQAFTMTSRLYSDTVTAKSALSTFASSMRRSTCRSDPCAVKLYGMPVSRLMMNAAAVG